MAAISKHGGAVGSITLITEVRTYCKDGTILVDRGDGNKVYGKVKKEYTPGYALGIITRVWEDWRCSHPMGAAYADRLHSVCGRRNWGTVDLAISISYTDPDGAKVDLEDLAGIDLDIEEVVTLCRLYEGKIAERTK